MFVTQKVLENQKILINITYIHIYCMYFSVMILQLLHLLKKKNLMNFGIGIQANSSVMNMTEHHAAMMVKKKLKLFA